VSSGTTGIAGVFDQRLISVASSADGTKLVAVAGFSGHIFTSSDSGATWTQTGTPQDWMSVASSANGTKLVAVGESGISTSSDSGVTWTRLVRCRLGRQLCHHRTAPNSRSRR